MDANSSPSQPRRRDPTVSQNLGQALTISETQRKNRLGNTAAQSSEQQASTTVAELRDSSTSVSDLATSTNYSLTNDNLSPDSTENSVGDKPSSMPYDPVLASLEHGTVANLNPPNAVPSSGLIRLPDGTMARESELPHFVAIVEPPLPWPDGVTNGAEFKIWLKEMREDMERNLLLPMPDDDDDDFADEPREYDPGSFAGHWRYPEMFSERIEPDGGSTSCGVGINPVPTLVTLDGGYDWLTVEPTTITESGTAVETNEAVWTAVQTSYLDVIAVTTTDDTGSTIISTSTQFFSFVTTQTGTVGAAPTPIIDAAIIAPALIPHLQPVVNEAFAKPVGILAAEILTALDKAGIVGMSTSDALFFATLISIIGATGVIVEGIHLYKAFKLLPYMYNLNIPPIPPTPAATSASTTSSAVEYTAIVELPYTTYLPFTVLDLPSGPTPTDDDFATSTSSAATVRCKQSYTGAGVEFVEALVTVFCLNIDTTTSSSRTLQGSDAGLTYAQGTSVLFSFEPTGNTCSLSCNDSYAKMIQTCEFDSHNIYGSASFDDGCGSFAMAISVASSSSTPSPTSVIAPTPTPTPCNYGWCGAPFCSPICGPS